MSPLVYGFFSLPKPGGVCLWLAGVTSGHRGTVVFPVGLNKQFCPQLNDRNGLGMRLQAFLVFLGAGPDCITGPVTRTDCDVCHGGHSHMMACLLRAFVLNNGQQRSCACV